MPSSPQEKFDCRPQAVDNWLQGLPRASVGVSAEMLYRALLSIQDQRLKAMERFQTLEKLREIVHYITLNMRRRFSGLTYPLPEKVVLIANASQSINELMAKGYRQVYHELQKQSFLFVDRKVLSTSIHRSISYLERCLIIVFEIYSAYQHNYWEQLHELYHYAELHKLSKQPVADNYLQKKRSTIEQEYLRACLLSLVEPYHLRSGDIMQVYKFSEAWSAMVKLNSPESEQLLLESKCIALELDRDAPPMLTGRTAVSSELQYVRCLNLENLIRELEENLQKMIGRQQEKAKVTKDEISINLLKRVIETLANRKTRRFPRQQVLKKVNVTIGMHDTHRQLMYELYMHDKEKLKKLQSGFTLPKYDTVEIKDVNTENSDIWSTVYSWANSNTPEESVTSTEDDDIFSYRVKQDNWTLLNESARGFALLTVESEAQKIQIGEIISVQRQGSTTRDIGIVRWLKSYNTTGVEVGCMLLAPSAIPVGMITERNAGADRIVNRGLLLPDLPVIKQRETILTFSRSFNPNDLIMINMPDDKDFYIRLSQLVADNESIAQFSFFRESDRKIENTSDDPLYGPDESAFNDIWKII